MLGNLSKDTKLLIAVSAAQVVGLMGPSLFPFLTGIGVDIRHMSFSSVGHALTTAFLARGVGAILAAPLIARFSKKTLLVAGVIIAAVAYALEPFTPNHMLIGLALFGGLGTGCVLGTSFALMAESDSPTALCGKVMLLTGVSLSLFCMSFPVMLSLVDNKFGFPISLTCLTMLPVIYIFTPSASTTDKPQEESADTSQIHPGVLLVVCALAGYALGELSRQTLWTFVERRGQVVGFTGQQVGLVLGLTALVGLGGAILASFLGLRRGRVIPLAIGIVMTTLGMFCVMYFSSQGSFIFCRAVWAFGESFYAPFYVGAIAAMDPRGRLNSVAAGLAALGGSVGPTFGGFIVDVTGYVRDATFVACIIHISLIAFILPAALRLDKRLKAA